MELWWYGGCHLVCGVDYDVSSSPCELELKLCVCEADDAEHEHDGADERDHAVDCGGCDAVFDLFGSEV